MVDRTRTRLLEFLASRGEEPIPNQFELGLPPPPALAVSDSRSVSVVLPLTKEQVLNGNALLRVIVNAASHRGRANRIYVAVPKLYAASLDGGVLQENGIGLIVYDAKRVFESIPARDVILRAETEDQSSAELKSEVAELRSRVESLEGALLSASKEIRELKDSVKELKRGPSRGRAREGRPEISVVAEVPHKADRSGLPSFLRSNPWVEVLSTRGEEG